MRLNSRFPFGTVPYTFSWGIWYPVPCSAKAKIGIKQAQVWSRSCISLYLVLCLHLEGNAEGLGNTYIMWFDCFDKIGGTEGGLKFYCSVLKLSWDFHNTHKMSLLLSKNLKTCIFIGTQIKVQTSLLSHFACSFKDIMGQLNIAERCHKAVHSKLLWHYQLMQNDNIENTRILLFVISGWCC